MTEQLAKELDASGSHKLAAVVCETLAREGGACERSAAPQPDTGGDGEPRRAISLQQPAAAPGVSGVSKAGSPSAAACEPAAISAIISKEGLARTEPTVRVTCRV